MEFMNIVESYENGQKSQCYRQFKSLSNVEQDQFIDWLYSQFEGSTRSGILYTLIKRMID